MHELEIYWDNVVGGAWVLRCSCGGLTNDNYGLSLEVLGKRADEHMAKDMARFHDLRVGRT